MEMSVEDCRRRVPTKSHNNTIYSWQWFSASHFGSIIADLNSSVNLKCKMRRGRQ